MVLPGVYLLLNPAYYRPVRPHNNKQVFAMPTIVQRVDNLDMSKPLLVGADLILAFDYEHSVFRQHPVGLCTSIEVQSKYCSMVAIASLLYFLQSVVFRECLLPALICGVPSCAFHVRWVEHQGVYGGGFIGELSAVHALLNVSGEQPIFRQVHVAPEHAATVRNIGHRPALRHMEFEHVGEDVCIARDTGREYKVGRRHSPLRAARANKAFQGTRRQRIRFFNRCHGRAPELEC